MRWWLAIVLLIAAGCSRGPEINPPRHFKVMSESFDPGGTLPEEFTCDGANISPSIGWEQVPDEAVSYALSMTDTDANGFVHWVVLGISDIRHFPTGHLPPGSVEGSNDFDRAGYGGPCPPQGDAEHHYVFTVYALDRPGTFFSAEANGGFAPGHTLDDMLTVIKCCVLASGTVQVTYGR
jgi:Raf kinase inhibitor-like YbhB/YbcL family protein